MSMYNVDKLPVAIPIGVQTETGVEEIRIDVSEWLKKWPDMVCSIHHTRPGETDSYPVVTTMEEGVIFWHVSDADTALQGVGTMEILGLTPDERHRKLTGSWCSTVVKDSTLDESGEVPEAVRPWVDQVMLAADKALSATQKMPTISVNHTWMVWDVNANAYVDTGLLASGKPGPEGPQGRAATIKVGKVTTTSPGTQANVANSGTEVAAVLDFYIPRGEPGRDGSNGRDGTNGSNGRDGVDGVSPTVNVQEISGGNRVTITDKNGSQVFDVMNGKNGEGGGGSGGGTDGEDGGYYQPSVSSDGILSWSASKADMPSVESANIKGPAGQDGAPGKDGTSVTVASVSTSSEDSGANVVTFSDGKTVTIFNGSKGSPGKDGSDGRDGQDGAPGKDGTSVTVASVSESTEDGGTNVVTFSDGKTLNVHNGSKGSPGEPGADGEDGYTPVKGKDYFDGEPGPAGANGKTPVKGTDYWTTDDKTAIVNEALAALAGADPSDAGYAELKSRTTTLERRTINLAEDIATMQYGVDTLESTFVAMIHPQFNSDDPDKMTFMYTSRVIDEEWNEILYPDITLASPTGDVYAGKMNYDQEEMYTRKKLATEEYADNIIKDWNVPSGYQGHILNRTHYDVDFEDVVFEGVEQVLSGNATMNYFSFGGTPADLQAGKEYTIIINGTEFKYVAERNDDDEFVILLDSGKYYIEYIPGYDVIMKIADKSITSVDLKICLRIKEFKKLDSKFIDTDNLVLTAPNGSKFRLTVDNNGNLGTVAVE